MRERAWSAATAAVVAPRHSALLGLVVITLLAAACGGSQEAGPPEPAQPPPNEPTPAAPATATERPAPPEPGSPEEPVTPTEPAAPTEPPDNVPQEPYTPGPHPEDRCGEVLLEATEAIEASREPQAEAHAYRGFARLCLGQEATADLEFARDHADELSAETRDLLEAVIERNSPKGSELREVLRERAGP